MTVIFPTRSSVVLPATPMRLTGSYRMSMDCETMFAASGDILVIRTDVSPRWSILSAMEVICSGVLPAPKMTSGTPCLSPR